MKFSSPRTASSVPSAFQSRLSAYALASAAAGVSILPVTQAEAEVVFTPVNGVIAEGGKYSLDLNNDGVIDFTLLNDLHLSTTPFGCDLDVSPAVKGNGVIQGMRERYNQIAAAALPAGFPIGTGKPFVFQQVNLAYASLVAGSPQYVSGGPWKGATNRYLGLKFLINGEVHFGWARLTVRTDSRREAVHATLTGYAYETNVNTPILAGQTSATAEQAALVQPISSRGIDLGLLAQGSSGLSVWRRGNVNES
jgi:hypothetical protein